MGFSRTFWSNAVEAEVYTVSMFLMLAINYLAVYWGQSDPEEKNDNILILISYLAWFSLGVHMTTFIFMLPGVLYLIYIDYNETYLKRWPVWVVMAMFILYALPVQTEIFWLFGIDISAYELESFFAIFAAFFAIALIVTIIKKIRQSESYKAWALATTVMIAAVVGYSSQAYIPIRADEKPAINENAPYTWARFKGFLERKQYGQESMLRRMFKRRGSWVNQIISDPKFGLLNNLDSQYCSPDERITIFEARGGSQESSGADFSLSLSMIYILIIGLYGMFVSLRRSPPDGFLLVGLTLLCTLGMAVYMNFSDGSFNDLIAPIAEVRNRDYFYTPGFMYYGIIIGIGLAALIGRIGESMEKSVGFTRWLKVALFIGACLGSTAMAAQTLSSNLRVNDRRGNYLPVDYAKNILDSCDKDGIIFTNGDNDTFPLWYIQTVEHYRTDVKVVNLSLLNTSWYVHQLKEQMGVPIQMSDSAIDNLQPFRISGSDRVYRIQDQMVQQIIGANQADGWKTPIYFAITVPEENRLGLDDHLVMEGMAYRVVASSGDNRVNTAVGLRVFGNKANFRGVNDPSVVKDDNERRMILNYTLAVFQVADDYFSRGELDSAYQVARMGADMVGDDAPWQIKAYLAKILAAEGKFDEVLKLAQNTTGGENILLSASQELIKNSRIDEAEGLLRETLQKYPTSFTALNNLAAIFYQKGNDVEFDSLVTEFRKSNSGDSQILAMLDQIVKRLKSLPRQTEGTK